MVIPNILYNLGRNLGETSGNAPTEPAILSISLSRVCMGIVYRVVRVKRARSLEVVLLWVMPVASRNGVCVGNVGCGRRASYRGRSFALILWIQARRCTDPSYVRHYVRMRICWLVLTHAHPVQFGRLVSAISGRGDHVVAHIDAKSDISPFRTDRVDFLEDRVNVRWGGWSMVEATLRLLSHGREFYPDADYYWLTSGDSYPVRSLDYIHRFLSDRPGVDFINYLPMPSVDVEKPISRISHYYIEHDPRSSRFAIGYKVLHRLMRRPYRISMSGMTPYCGSQWFVLQADTVDHLFSRMSANPRFVRLSKTSRVPDEFFFQTLVVNDSLNYGFEPAPVWADFRPSPYPRPPVIRDSQLSFLRDAHLIGDNAYGSQEILLARKFADVSSAEIEIVQQEFWRSEAGD